MNRRDFLKAVGLSASAAACATRPADAEPSKPNILYIMADDMGYSDLGCYGGEIRTPNLDRLGYEGMRLTRYYANNMCVPTRAAAMTGIQSDLSVVKGAMPSDFKTLPAELKKAGYKTYMTGKWHLCEDVDDFANYPKQRGFDRFYGGLMGSYSFYAPYSLMRENEIVHHEYENDPDFYFTDTIADNMVSFLQDGEDDASPFFAYLAFNAAHWPLHARAEDVAKWRGRYAEGWDKLRDERHARQKELGVINPDWPLSPRNPEVPAWEDEPHKEWQQRRMEVYAAQVEVMDAAIGRVLAEIERQGKLDETLIVFQIDNGGCHVEYFPEREGDFLNGRVTRDGRPMKVGNVPDVMPGPEDTFQSYGYGWANASNTPFRLYKQHDHEGGIAVPLIARWPGVIEAGAVNEDVVHVTDVMPTFLEAAGATDTPKIEGRSFLSVLKGQGREPREILFWQWNRGRAVRQGRWKLVAVKGGDWELYDVEADGTELNDLAAEMPEKAAELGALWTEWSARRAL